MPANKYALLRYRIIDRCLTNRMRPHPTKEDLRRACEEGLYGSEGERISISTIEKDLWAMRNENELGYHAPIVYNAEHRGYEYEDPDYSISGLNLQEQDLQALRFATLTLLQFRDMPVFQQYQSAIGRIFDRVHATAPGRGIDQHIQFEQAPQTLGTEHIAALMSAIGEHRVVRFTYRKFVAGDRQESERCIEPYLLKEYRNRWYLIGKPEGSTDVRTFALDRRDKWPSMTPGSFATPPLTRTGTSRTPWASPVRAAFRSSGGPRHLCSRITSTASPSTPPSAESTSRLPTPDGHAMPLRFTPPMS